MIRRRQNQTCFNTIFPPDTDSAICSSFFSKLNLVKTSVANSTSKENQDKKRIMLVDDEHDISIVFKSGLERYGFSVDVFNNPKEALANFKAEYYDILLFDVKMPEMNGFELCAETKKVDNRPKVIFVSAFEVHEGELKKYLLEENMNCIVKKPVSIKQLIKILNEGTAD